MLLVLVLTLVCCLHFTIVQIPLQLLLYVARCIDKMQHIISVFDDAYPTQISMTPTFVSSFVSGLSLRGFHFLHDSLSVRLNDGVSLLRAHGLPLIHDLGKVLPVVTVRDEYP